LDDMECLFVLFLWTRWSICSSLASQPYGGFVPLFSLNDMECVLLLFLWMFGRLVTPFASDDLECFLLLFLWMIWSVRYSLFFRRYRLSVTPFSSNDMD
jgi:hypothetical protein